MFRLVQFLATEYGTGVEADFIADDLECAIECQSSAVVPFQHLKGVRELKREHSSTGRRIVVSREPKSRQTSDGIEILTVAERQRAFA